MTKMCLHRPQAIKRAKSQSFPLGNLFFPFLSERGDCKYFKACPSVKVSRKHSQIWPVYVNLRWNVTQKLDPTLEPSNYKQIRMFSAENSICPRRFIRDGPEVLHTCSTCMSNPRPWYIRGVLFIVAEYIWSYVVRMYACIHVSKKSAES